MTAEVLLALATGVSAVAAVRVLALLKYVWDRRTERDRTAANKQIEITYKLAHSTKVDDSVLAGIIDSLEGIENAVVIAGDWAIVKDSVGGEPHMMVRQLSSRQRELIHKHEAPINDAAAFQSWLGVSSAVG